MMRSNPDVQQPGRTLIGAALPGTTIPGSGSRPDLVAVRPSGGRKLSTYLAPAFTALVVLLLPGAGVLAAFVLVIQGRVRFVDLALLVGMFLITGLGITVGFHRLATHRSFQTHSVIKGLLLILGSMAFQGSVTSWMAIHIKHHAH